MSRCKSCHGLATASWKARNPDKAHGAQDHQTLKDRKARQRLKPSHADRARSKTKVCRVCKKTKPLTQYKAQAQCIDGYGATCTVCLKPKRDVYRAKYQVTAWVTLLTLAARTAAQNRGCDFTLTKADVQALYDRQGGRCYWFQVPLVPSAVTKHPQKPSLDRLDATKGYTPDNVVLSCYAANIGRNTSTSETFEAFVILLRESLQTEPCERRSLERSPSR